MKTAALCGSGGENRNRKATGPRKSTPFAARPQARRRRTKAQIEQLHMQMMDVLRDDHPQSVRHVFYRMTDPRLPEPVEKSDKGYVTVQRQLALLRQEGKLRYDWISDSTRWGYFVSTYEGPSDALSEIARFYRKSVWTQTPVYAEVWCESRSLAGVIREETERYAIPLYPAGGFSSLTLTFEASEYIREASNDRPVHIIYIGDYDPAGVLIDKKIEQALRGHLPDHDITFHRIAVTREQIDLMSLPTKPGKPGDRRGGFTDDTVEAEAMPAAIMRQLLREKIESFIPARTMEVVTVAEESERELLLKWAAAMSGEVEE